MNKKYIIGAIIIIGFVIVAMYSFNDSTTKYVSVAEAKESKETVQLSGSWLKDKKTEYNAENNIFEFHIKDEKGNEIRVLHEGVKPNNFEIANMVVVKGHYNGNAFKSNQLLTKCPSKYEGTAEELKGH